MKLLLIIGLILAFQYVIAQGSGNTNPCYKPTVQNYQEDDSEEIMKELLYYFE